MNNYITILEAAKTAYENSEKAVCNKAFYRGQLTTLYVIAIMDDRLNDTEKFCIENLINFAEQNI